MGPPTEESQFWTVADLMIPDSLNWNINRIKSLLPAYEKDILSLKPSKTGALDGWAWLPASDGLYTTKSGYYESLPEEESDSSFAAPTHQESFLWKTNIWSITSSPKTKLLLWKMAQQALPVGENLSHRQVSDSVKCPHCSDSESELHLFFTCPFALQIWRQAPFKESFNPVAVPSIKDGIMAVRKLTCLPPSGIGNGPLFPWIFWTIWTSRNQLIFSKKHIPAEEALLLAIIRAKEWQQAQSSFPPVRSTRSPIDTLPTSHSVTCFTDASWKSEDKAGLGWVFKDRQEHLLQQDSALVTLVRSPLMAEALATLAAVRVAIESAYTHISFASDSLTLVKALNLKLRSKELHGILHDILFLSANFISCSFNFISRDNNREADALAKSALDSPCMET